MSVEALAIAAVVDEGAAGLRKLYAAGVSGTDFPMYEEEFEWIEKRLASRKTMNKRIFKQKFPDFDFLVPKDSLVDLASELKEERAFDEMNSLIETMSDKLERGNAVDLALIARDELSKITRAHLPKADIRLTADWKDHVKEMKQGMLLHKNGVPVGIPTGVPHLDHHWGGMMPGNMIVVLGRPGEGKSYKTTMFAWTAMREGYQVGLFTPEMSKAEVRARLHTLASAERAIQEACGLKGPFKNRNLLFRHGFNIKKYEAFCEYLASLKGEVHMLTGTHRRAKMTVGYIEDRIEELGLDLVIVDPIYKLRPVRNYRDNPWMELGATSGAIEDLAETYNIPIVITNQAHRQGGNSADAPHKDKSHGSDVPVQEADYVLGVKNMSEENRMLCRCSKSRFGQEFHYEMAFFPNTGRMYPITRLDGNGYIDDKDIDGELREILAVAKNGRDEEEGE